ncbi:MAG TPA: aminopeptidase P family N-terminal domain-containing protein, partial [Candidatus Saccharimonadia bacterium]|nr:aminopeptidase P family N-terminal domain-containing protein [Candidatus Saccharimonadia bacterium]
MSGASLVDAATRAGWLAADRAARPARLERLRARMEREGVDAYFGVRVEHARYLTGFELGDGEEKVSGNSGWFLITADEVVVLADSRYTEQAEEQCPDARIAEAYNDLPIRWPALVAGHHRVAAEADVIPQALWSRLLAAEPAVELMPIEG